MTNLPIAAYCNEIIGAVKQHRVVVVTAETGAGKSTQVPQYLAETGYDVVVTQPRRIAARVVAERVAEEMEVEFGSVVGYRTGYERQDSPETQILFCTDGLQLVREITGSGKAQVLVIDEVHEWNINIETLVAWARKRLSEEAPFKVVLMSATLEASKLAAYFAEVTGECPVISVPGRLFPVEKSEKPANSLVSTVKGLIGGGRNVLVFQPGKREIEDTVLALTDTNAMVLPLHGQLSASEQRRVFQHYSQPKVVVSTNVAQTSVTIDDIDAVVDSGLERRIELVDGVEGLYLKPTSQADCQQRAGRAGRTKEGVYILCSDAPLNHRPGFPVAEIMRSRLDQVVLRLAVAGIDASELTFFHQPDRNTVTEAKRTCIALGFMTQEGEITSLGKRASRLPVGVKVARMVLEGAKRGCLDKVLTVAAIMEIGSLKARNGRWSSLVSENTSDALAELYLYEKALQMERSGQRDYFTDAGIFAKSYFRAKELRRKLERAVRRRISFESGGSCEDVVRSVVAGMVDHLYQYAGRNRYGILYKNGDGYARQLARESVVKSESPWVVAMPFDLEIETRRGKKTLNLVQWVTKVDPAWLVEVAPQFTAVERRNYRYDVQQGIVVCDLVTKFGDQEINTDVVEGTGEDAVQAFALALTKGSVKHPCVVHNREVREEMEDLNRRWAAKLGTIESGDLTTWYELHLEMIHTLSEALELDLNLTDADVSDLLCVENYAIERLRIKEERPDTWLIAGEDHTLTYEWSTWYFKGVKTELPIAVLSGLTAENLPSWEGMQVRVSVSDEDYADLYITLPEQELDTLREKIEARRQELAWKAFVANGHGDYDRKEEVTYQSPLPRLPEAEVWDAETRAHTYPAWVYYPYDSRVWYLHWYRSQEQAHQVQQKAEAKLLELDAAEHERLHLEELKAEAEQLYEEVDQLLFEIDLGSYKAYGLSKQEAGVDLLRSSQSLQKKLEEVRRIARGVSPRQAIAQLKELKARIEEAFEYFVEIEPRRQEAYQTLVHWLAINEHRGYDSQGKKEKLVAVVREVIRAEGDYFATLEQIAEFEEWETARQKQQDAGEIWMDVTIPISIKSQQSEDSWCISPEGKVIEPQKKDTGGRRPRVEAHLYGDVLQTHLVVSHSSDTYGYRRSESWTVHHLPGVVTQAQRAKLEEIEQECCQFFRGSGTGWDVTREGTISFTTVYSRDLRGTDREAYDAICTSMPIDVVGYKLYYKGDPISNMHLDDANLPVVVGFKKKTSPQVRQVESSDSPQTSMSAAWEEALRKARRR